MQVAEIVIGHVLSEARGVASKGVLHAEFGSSLAQAASQLGVLSSSAQQGGAAASVAELVAKARGMLGSKQVKTVRIWAHSCMRRCNRLAPGSCRPGASMPTCSLPAVWLS